MHNSRSIHRRTLRLVAVVALAATALLPAASALASDGQAGPTRGHNWERVGG